MDEAGLYIHDTSPNQNPEVNEPILPHTASPVLTGMGRKADATSDTAMPMLRAAKLDIADFLLDAASRNNPVVRAAERAGQLAECREDFSNKIP